MRYLLDTVAISESVRPRPDPGYVQWLQAQVEHDLALSILTIGEIRRGIIRSRSPQRSADLERWLGLDVLWRFEGRLLPADYEVSLAWAQLMEDVRARGQQLPIIDSIIAATALAHELAVVTRNGADFERCGVAVIDPWSTGNGMRPKFRANLAP